MLRLKYGETVIKIELDIRECIQNSSIDTQNMF